jgi:hypothetical protein
MTALTVLSALDVMIVLQVEAVKAITESSNDQGTVLF